MTENKLVQRLAEMVLSSTEFWDIVDERMRNELKNAQYIVHLGEDGKISVSIADSAQNLIVQNAEAECIDPDGDEVTLVAKTCDILVALT